MALKKKELELRLTEASLEQSHALLNERTELIKQERQVVRSFFICNELILLFVKDGSRTIGFIQKMRRISFIGIKSSISGDCLCRTLPRISKCDTTK